MIGATGRYDFVRAAAIFSTNSTMVWRNEEFLISINAYSNASDSAGGGLSEPRRKASRSTTSGGNFGTMHPLLNSDPRVLKPNPA
jgi:hypothetical protein